MNEHQNQHSQRVVRYGLTALNVFVWSLIEYPYSICWFLGMMFLAMKKAGAFSWEDEVDVAGADDPASTNTSSDPSNAREFFVRVELLQQNSELTAPWSGGNAFTYIHAEGYENDELTRGNN